MRSKSYMPLADRGPLHVLFAITSMPVGGAETLLASLVRRLDRERFLPEICCLKEPGPLGESLAQEVPVHSRLLRSKWDVRVLSRLRRLIRSRRIDAVITVGAGDKMFWGRLAAWLEDVPVICSALHSTGWPDHIGFLNHRLTAITDAFIAVAQNHGEYLVSNERFPPGKVHVIPNGIDTQVFQPLPEQGREVRRQLGIPEGAPVAGVVAALRPEKNLSMFLQAAARMKRQHPDAQFLIVGDGPERGPLERLANELGISTSVYFLGSRADVPRILAAMDVFTLTSNNEANPVSILEALACAIPVVATRVGSVHETVIPGQTGFLVQVGHVDELVTRVAELFAQPTTRQKMGAAGRQRVAECGSLQRMVQGYESLWTEIYERKYAARLAPSLATPAQASINPRFVPDRGHP